ncbi:tetratricopeptide repeat protein 27 homolog [Papaver somniferum]|uniref:tetratricopeptide repeat protein 27 homolog n=1 Tax=Papaver somniferum TaxID=3469 RepID=UPI000E6FA16B|nr:tetratricopeptide repeat protein 27 homolog [Papaver somniferum]XP_026406487.1 tetratricopeptide repeat protein 27 homolog [Papaver somniferum]
MANHQLDNDILRGFELRLLRCTLSSSSSSPPSTTATTIPSSSSPSPAAENGDEKTLYELIDEIVSLIENGNYLQALSSQAVRLLFDDSCQNSIDSVENFYNQVNITIESFLSNPLEEVGDESNWFSRALLVNCVAVAAFLAFTQINLTGPLENFPSFPLASLGSTEVSCGREWDMWARRQLMSTGSDLHGKFSLLQYIVFAKMLLVKTKDISFERKNSSCGGTRTLSWWLSRLILLQQRISEELSSSLFDTLQVLMQETLDHFGKLESISSYWGTQLHEGEALDVLTAAHLQAGIIEYTYGRIDHFSEHLKSAEIASGLQLSVTGMLGFRTVHQERPVSLRVLVVNSNTSKPHDISPTTGQGDTTSSDDCRPSSNSSETYGVSDILMTPKLLDDGKVSEIGASDSKAGWAANTMLGEIQQAVVLVQCLLISKSSREAEYERWDMSPYIEAIDAQQLSYFIIRRFCDLLRIRWESSRGRTKERSLMMMDNQVQGIYNSSPGAADRIRLSYEVYVPTIPALRKEYGELLVRCGLIGEALKIFEDLELWNNVIDCYCLIEKKAAAVELIKERLCELPNDPRLWCSLGDVTNIDAHYEKALEVSNNKSARAKRSLARSAYNRGHYEESKTLWESAMALNSLFPDGWFALGAAALKAQDIDMALIGFSRAVELDPDNGEAWNNIACLHMMKESYKKAFTAFKEALKFRRSSWQMWENFSQVSFEIGNLRQALEATKKVLDTTNNKRIDVQLLERVMVEIEAQALEHSCAPSKGNSSSPDSDSTRSLEAGHLVELLGNVLQQVVRGGGGENIWGLYARWHKLKRDLTMCSEALLKHVRFYQGADLWKNRDRFKKFANASLQLCEVYMEIASSTGSCRELNSAEMHLRSVIRQAVNFSDTDELRDLQACLEEVKKRIEAASISSNGNIVV